MTGRGGAAIIKCMVGPALRYPREQRDGWARSGLLPSRTVADRHMREGDMMKSVMAVENRKDRRRGGRLRLFMFVVGLYLCALLAGCATKQPGETAAEVNRRHKRSMSLNTQMLMSDIDKFLLLDRPSILTDKRVP